VFFVPSCRSNFHLAFFGNCQDETRNCHSIKGG
jgi:hypothetical protein